MKPKLGETQPLKVSYSAGDRVIARLGTFPTSDQIKKIRKGINSFAGVELNSLIIDCSSTSLVLERGGAFQSLAGPGHITSERLNSSKPIFSFGVAKFVKYEGDRFYLSSRHSSPSVRSVLLKQVQHWVGDSELIFIDWKEF